jgi:hypothetical protein
MSFEPSAPPNDCQWLTYSQAASICGICKRTLQRYLKTPNCQIKPVAMFSQRPRISRRQLETVLKNLPVFKAKKNQTSDFTSGEASGTSNMRPSRE